MCDDLQSDEELLEAFYACEAGEEHGLFQQLYDRHAKRLICQIRGKVHDRYAADDLLQTVFLKVLRTKRQSAARCPRGAKVEAWLATIASHAAIDRYRHEQMRAGSPTVGQEEDEGGDAVRGRARPSRVTSVEEASEKGLPQSPKPLSPPDEATIREKKARLRKALENLPEPHRSILHWKFWGYASQRDIGGALGMSDVQMARAVERAYRMLEKKLGGEADQQ